MVEAILGMGEVGTAIFNLLSERNYSCVGIDIDESKCRNYSKNELLNIDFLHVCIPGETKNFVQIVKDFISNSKINLGIIIHSTVIPGTTTKIQNSTKLPVIFSPVRGVHRRFVEDLKRYTKFFALDIISDNKIETEFLNRFKKVEKMKDTKTCEYAKILVDTTYYGWLINYAQITKIICDKNNIDYDEMWKFSNEIHEFLGNRPKMFPGIIGGHCVIPNLSLINEASLDSIKTVNDLFRKFTTK